MKALPILRFVGGVERPESWFIRRGSLKGEENYYLRRIFVAFPPPRGLRVGYRRQSMGHGKCPIGGSPKRWYASKLQPKLVNKFKAATGNPAFNTLWEALALLIACRIWLPCSIWVSEWSRTTLVRLGCYSPCHPRQQTSTWWPWNWLWPRSTRGNYLNTFPEWPTSCRLCRDCGRLQLQNSQL